MKEIKVHGVDCELIDTFDLNEKVLCNYCLGSNKISFLKCVLYNKRASLTTGLYCPECGGYDNPSYLASNYIQYLKDSIKRDAAENIRRLEMIEKLEGNDDN